MRNKKYTIILSIITVIESIFVLAIPYFTNELVDYSLAKDKNNVIIYSILLASICILSILFHVLDNILYSKYSLKLEEEIKKNLYDLISKKAFPDLNKYHAAEIELLYTEDTQNIIRDKLSIIPTLIRNAVRVILAVILLVYIVHFDWKLITIVLVSGTLGIGMAKVYSHYMKPRHKKVLESSGKANSFIVESKNNLKIIEAYMAKDYAKEYYNSLLKKEIQDKRNRNYLLYGANSILYAFSAIIYVGPIIYGAFGILNDWFTYGALIALVMLVRQIESPLISLSPLMNQHALGKTSEERINKVLSLSDMEEVINIKSFDSIIFDHVSFSYDKDHPVLKDLSFEIKKGETVLLFGPSGIGKTTIFMLMMGFIAPLEGKIYLTIDGKREELSSKHISLFSYVPQENILFSGTILDNFKILTGKDEEEIKNALKLANVYDEIMAMKDGLNTILKDRGEGLSLGQIQRLLIACAILHDSEILLLDEFSSALDINNELEIINNLKGMNKTIIYITHRSKHMEESKIIHLKES